jgi:hypothetical protein
VGCGWVGRNVGIGGTRDLIKLHAWGSNRMNVQPGSSPQWLRRILLNKLFILQLSKYVSLWSSRFFFVSNLRRSNWKCTDRFFKSTVNCDQWCEGVASSSVKQGIDAK